MAQEKLLAEWFWTDRWIGSSAFGLPIDARGLYREMLTQAWRRGAQLPNDYDQIRRMTGVTEREWRRAWPLIEKYWRVDEVSLVNDTQLEVYAEAQGRSVRASERGLRGAQARAQALLKQKLSTVQDKPECQPPSPSPSPIVPVLKNRQEPFDADASEALRMRAGELVQRYGELFHQYRRGAKYHARPAHDFPKACELVQTWTDDARLEKLAILILTTDEKWIAGTDRGFSVFASKASWADDRLREWEESQGVSA